MIISETEFFNELEKVDLVPAPFSKGFVKYTSTIGKPIFQKTREGLSVCYEIKPNYFHSGHNLSYGGIIPYNQHGTVDVKLFLKEAKIDTATFCSYSFFPRLKYFFGHEKFVVRYNVFIVDLKKYKAVDEIFCAFKGEERTAIRKAIKNGLVVVRGTQTRQIQDFMDLMAENYARLGGGHTLDKKLVEMVLEFGSGFLLLAYKNEQLLGGNFVVRGKGHWLSWYVCSSLEGRKLRVNNLLYWRLLEQAFENGVEFLDYGSSELDDETHSLFKQGMLGDKFGVKVINRYGSNLKNALYWFVRD